MLITEVVDRALGCGLVSADEALWHGVKVDSVGRSHSVYRVAVGDSPRAFIKHFGPSRGGTDGDVASELAVYALGERPAVAAVLPARLRWDDDPQVVVTEAVDGSSAWAADWFGGGAEHPVAAWSALVEAAVPALARVHLATRDLAMADATVPDGLGAPVPWGLRVFSPDAPVELWADPYLGALLEAAADDEIVRSGVRAARRCWRRMCLVHGDLKHDNVLLADGGRVIFVDWEMARVGDPAWDLAALLARLPLISATADVWPEAAREGARHLVDAYVAETPMTAPAVAKRVVLYTGAWLVMAAVQSRSIDYSPEGADGAHSLIAKAAMTFARAPELVRELAGGTDA